MSEEEARRAQQEQAMQEAMWEKAEAMANELEYDAISWAKGLWWDIQVRPGRFDANMCRAERDRYVRIVMVTLIRDSACYLLKDPYLFDREKK
jgi:hypothetical protein